MKISQMTNDQACDALIRITDPVANIADDPQMEPILKGLAEHEGENGLSALKAISQMLPKIVPMLLKDHKKDVYEIISVLSGKAVAEIGKMRITETIAILKESIDDDLIGFFKQSSPVKSEAGEGLQ